MRIIVSGASGFLGSWICRILALSHDVTALVRPQSDTWRLEGIAGLSIINKPTEFWASMVNHIEPNALVMADWTGVDNSSRNDIAKQTMNIARIRSFTDGIRISSLETVVALGSQAELGPVEGIIKDSQPFNPTTQYGKSKQETYELLNDASNVKGFRLVWLRVFSCYGALSSRGWLLSDSIEKMKLGSPLDLTYGDQNWNFLHVYDFALSVKKLLETPNINGKVNVGSYENVKIKDVIKTLSGIMKSSSELNFGAIPYRPDQVMELSPLCETMRNIHWEPIVRIEDGLRHTVDWHLGFRSALWLSTGNSLDIVLPNAP